MTKRLIAALALLLCAAPALAGAGPGHDDTTYPDGSGPEPVVEQPAAPPQAPAIARGGSQRAERP